MNPYLASFLTAGGSDLYKAIQGDWKNPADEAMPGVHGIPDKMSPYFDPFIDAGKRQIPGLEGQYGQLTGDPGGFINKMGQGYQQSPGFEFAMKRALGGANQAAAAGGMAGSPQSMEWNQDIASNMASRDYNNWMDRAMGAYGRGLSGQEGLYGKGADMSRDFGQSIGNNALTEALLKYMGQNSENQRSGMNWGNFMGAGASLAGMFI